MEDALISPMGFMILSGAGLIEASKENKVKVHRTKVANEINYKDGNITIDLDEKPYFVTTDGKSSDDIELELSETYELDDSGKNNFIYIMDLENGEVCSEPYIPMSIQTKSVKKIRDLDKNAINVFTNSMPGSDLKDDYYTETDKKNNEDGSITFYSKDDTTTFYIPLAQKEKIIKMRIKFAAPGDNIVYINLTEHGNIDNGIELEAINGNGNIFEIYGNISDISAYSTLGNEITIDLYEEYEPDSYQLTLNPNDEINVFEDNKTVLVDYYVSKNSGAMQIDITPDKFGGNFYLEASTLFRETNGIDMPAEFIIPNCKIQSNFNFTMASSGDPSTFTFTMDAFPDYTRFDSTKKVLASIQIIEDNEKDEDDFRTSTKA